MYCPFYDMDILMYFCQSSLCGFDILCLMYEIIKIIVIMINFLSVLNIMMITLFSTLDKSLSIVINYYRQFRESIWYLT